MTGMIIGLNYIEQNGRAIELNDDTFWQIVDIDVCYIANEKYGGFVDFNPRYIEARKNAIRQVLLKAKNPIEKYEQLIEVMGKNRAKAQRNMTQIDDKQISTDEEPEEIHDLIDVRDFLSQDELDDDRIQTGSDTSKVDIDNDDPEDELDPWEIASEKKVKKYFEQYEFLTPIEKQALYNKLISKDDYPMTLFSDKGIKIIAYRALVKWKLVGGKN